MNHCVTCSKQITDRSTRCRTCNLRLIAKTRPGRPPGLSAAVRQAQWRLRHPERSKAVRDRQRVSKREWVAQLKAERGCEHCGIKDPRVLDLHHRDGEEKIQAVSQLVYSASWARIRAEVDKCEVLCANCHRISHAEEADVVAIVRAS